MSASPGADLLGRLAARHHEGGDGVPLLLAHGLTDDSGCWPDAFPHWRGHAVVAVDLTGHGRSPRLTDAELADPMRTVADDVATALHAAAERLGRPVVGIGHSMGAGALALAAIAGAPLAGLVLEDPRIAHRRTAVRARLGRMRARERELWLADPESARTDLDRACAEWSAAERDAAAAARPLVDPRLLATGTSGLDGDDGLQVDVVRQVAARVPTLLLTGDRPGAVWSPEAVAAVGGRTAVVVAGADHCVRRVQPQGYHAAVSELLDRAG